MKTPTVTGIALGALLAALVGTAPTAWATEPPLGFMGLGTSACPDFAINVKASKPDKKDYLLGFFSWAQGYMSGLNNFIVPKKQLNGISHEAQVAELYKYCMAHPDKTFSAAVYNLLDTLPVFPD